MIQVSVYRDGETYVAAIAGGWWVARGDTHQAAIEAALKRYYAEHETLFDSDVEDEE